MLVLCIGTTAAWPILMAPGITTASEPGPHGPSAGEPASPAPGEFVTVQLRDGRQVAGWVAPPIRPETLSIRVGGPGLSLTSHFSWALVESLAIAPAPPLPTSPGLEPSAGPIPAAFGPPPVPRAFMASPPRTIRLHTEPVNTDGDAAADSLRVVVLPLDERGRPTLASGQLNVSLTDEADRAPARFRADWSRDLRASDMTPDGFAIELPLRSPLPASTPARPLVLRVDASLSVPGAGRLEATQMLVPFIPPSLGILRDRLVTP
jgi:hypothetical protein